MRPSAVSSPPTCCRHKDATLDVSSLKIIGLTGGIGMGKSTAAAAFRRARIPVFDADLAVHRMQAKGGRAVKAIEIAFPGTTKDGAVDRHALRHAVLADREALTRLEHILHPMVEAEERGFVARARRAGKRAVVLDIPLLFETRGDKRVDTVVVVSAPRAIQIHRVAQRRRMSREDVEAVIARQMPDRDKRRRADLVVRTGLSRNHTLRVLHRFIRGLRA
jgi:dephospho-CoA kinase